MRTAFVLETGNPGVAEHRWARLDRLALEAKHLDPAVAFYGDDLGLELTERTDAAAVFAAGGTEIELRVPGPVPRGGVHTHYAFSIPAAEYDGWFDRLSTKYDLTQHTFGEARSLYCYDPDGNCVELGERPVDGPGIAGVFEVVLEVESLDRSIPVYRALGAEVVDRGADRRRVRLDCGALALELWEPHLGIADARGGVHVDMTVAVEDPHERVEAAAAAGCASYTETDAGVLFRDPDGHAVRLRSA